MCQKEHNSECLWQSQSTMDVMFLKTVIYFLAVNIDNEEVKTLILYNWAVDKVTYSFHTEPELYKVWEEEDKLMTQLNKESNPITKTHSWAKYGIKLTIKLFEM